MPYFLAASKTFSSDNTPTWYIDLMLSTVAKTVGEDCSSEMECRKAFNLLLAILLPPAKFPLTPTIASTALHHASPFGPSHES